MTTALAASPAETQNVSFGRLLRGVLLGGAVAAVTNVVIYFIAHASGQELTAQFQPGTVSALSPVPVVISSFVPGFLGAGLLFGLTKFLKQGVTVFAVIGAAFTLFSFMGPANLADASTGTKVVLDLMHVVAGAALTVSLVRAARSA